MWKNQVFESYSISKQSNLKLRFMTKIKLGIVAAILLMSNLVFAQTWQEGRKLISYQRYQSAVSTLEKVVAANPGSADAQYWLGQAYIESGQLEKAKEVYRKILVGDLGSNPLLLVGMGHVELLEGKKTDARSRFETAISLSKGKDVAVLNAIGRANADKNGDVDYAIEKLNQATTLKGFKEPDVYVNMGDAYRKKNDGGGAVSSYQKALIIDPKYAEASYKIGKVYYTQGKDQEEVFSRYLNEAIASDPNFAPAYYDFYVYFFFRDVNKAKNYFAQYKPLADPGVALDYEEASLSFASGDFKDAVAKSTELLNKYGNGADARLYRLRGYSNWKLGDSATAIKDFETFFSKAKEEDIVPDNWMVAAELAAKFPERQANFERYVNAAIAMDTTVKGKSDLAKKAVDIFKKAGNQPKAAEWAIRVLSLNPNASKVDLYNAGIENFKALEYMRSDSIFDAYKAKYPDETYGYYWSFRALSVVDSTMEQGLAIQDATKFVEIAELDKAKNKSTLMTAYGYLAGYQANIKKDFSAAIGYLDKILEIDPANPDAIKNKEILQKALSKGKKP
ncbi:MAG: tetratricopeptide repeat protein [Sphingobacteriales bacterium]|nr:MAG: tetratricopeptide repeat protein [Sphingobacteriales bacterium]